MVKVSAEMFEVLQRLGDRLGDGVHLELLDPACAFATLSSEEAGRRRPSLRHCGPRRSSARRHPRRPPNRQSTSFRWPRRTLAGRSGRPGRSCCTTPKAERQPRRRTDDAIGVDRDRERRARGLVDLLELDAETGRRLAVARGSGFQLGGRPRPANTSSEANSWLARRTAAPSTDRARLLLGRSDEVETAA